MGNKLLLMGIAVLLSPTLVYSTRTKKHKKDHKKGVGQVPAQSAQDAENFRFNDHQQALKALLVPKISAIRRLSDDSCDADDELCAIEEGRGRVDVADVHGALAQERESVAQELERERVCADRGLVQERVSVAQELERGRVCADRGLSQERVCGVPQACGASQLSPSPVLPVFGPETAPEGFAVDAQQRALHPLLFEAICSKRRQSDDIVGAVEAQGPLQEGGIALAGSSSGSEIGIPTPVSEFAMVGRPQTHGSPSQQEANAVEVAMPAAEPGQAAPGWFGYLASMFVGAKGAATGAQPASQDLVAVASQDLASLAPQEKR